MHDIRKLAALVPIRVTTNTGWKQAVKVTTSSQPHGMINAIVRYADDTESHHWFLPEEHEEKLVEVTHVICPDEVWSCVDRRRLSIVATLETFYRQLCQGRLPLSAYATDKSGHVMVKLDDGQSKCVQLWEAARNGLHLDLENYSKRWMEKCVENINCDNCRLPLIDAAQSRYVPGQDERARHCCTNLAVRPMHYHSMKLPLRTCRRTPRLPYPRYLWLVQTMHYKPWTV